MKGPPPVVEYRCAEASKDACLLLRIYATPEGPMIYTPRRRLSPGAAESLARSARSAEALTPLAQVVGHGSITGLRQCRHQLGNWDADELERDYASGLAAKQTVRRFFRNGDGVTFGGTTTRA